MPEYFIKNGKKYRFNTDEEEAAINKAAKQDPDNPPMTNEELARMRPATEVVPDIVKAHKLSRGRPKGSAKAAVSLRLDIDVINYFKGNNPKGWQTRINDELRKKLPKKNAAG